MGYYDESIKSLEFQPHHDCCENSLLYLFPPHQAGEFGTYFKYKVERQESWYIKIEQESVNVSHCPWCGVRLASE